MHLLPDVNTLPPTSIAEDGLLVGWRPNREQWEPVLLEGEGHLVTIAPTGAGKGVGALVPALLRHRGAAIVIDPKGENYVVTHRHRRAMGQQVVLLDPFGVTGHESRSLNPFDTLPGNPLRAATHLASFAELLYPKPTDCADPFWAEAGRQLTIGLLTAFITNHAPVNRTPARYHAFVSQAVSDPDRLIAQLRQCSAAGMEAHARTIEGAGREDTSARDVVAHTVGEVTGLSGAAVAASTGRTDFSLEALQRGDPITIYIVMPPEQLRASRTLMRLWVGSLMSTLTARRQRPAHSTLLLLDEAAQLGPMELLVTAMTLLRGYGVQCWSFWQDEHQLSATYPVNWETLLNNASVIQNFGRFHPGLHALLGGVTGPPMRAPVMIGGGISVHCHRRGHAPEFLRLPAYYKDPCFAGQSDANPRVRAADAENAHD